MNKRARLIFYGIIFTLVLATVIVFLNALASRIVDAESASDKNAARLDDALTAIGQLSSQVEALGGTPVVTPEEVPGPVDTPRNARGSTGDSGPIGPIGPVGPVGPAGPTGKPGPKGATGLTGAAGGPGTTGTNGVDGSQGSTGDTGPAGAKGDTGPAGPQGPKGDTGEAGATGPAGYPDSWSWSDPLGATYTCTDSDGDHRYTCDLSAGAPAGDGGSVE